MAWATFITLALCVPLSAWGAARDTDGTGWRFFGFLFSFWYAAMAAWLWFVAPIWGAA